jgi:threonine/homoserine/homoserine lactone efflux protein
MLVLKNGLNHRLSTALSTVAGIGVGIIFHATLATVGLSALLAASTIAHKVWLIAGAAYLTWIALRILLSLRQKNTRPDNASVPALSNAAAFREGLITNLLNPKVVLFFSSMLARFLKPDSPAIDRFIYPAIIIIEGIIVWSAIACLLQLPKIKQTFLRLERPINIAFALILLALAISALL